MSIKVVLMVVVVVGGGYGEYEMWVTVLGRTKQYVCTATGRLYSPSEAHFVHLILNFSLNPHVPCVVHDCGKQCLYVQRF